MNFQSPSCEQLARAAVEVIEPQSSISSHIHSGLSALIEAATSQLNDVLAEERERAEDFIILKAQPRVSHNFVITQQDGKQSYKSCEEERLHQLPTSFNEAKCFNDPAIKSTLSLPAIPSSCVQSFPEILMTLAINPDYADIITFLPDGKFFAIRSTSFESYLLQYLNISTFSEFMEHCSNWGFTRIHLKRNNCQGSNEIEVFRHPQFVKNDWQNCALIRPAERARIESCLTSATTSSLSSSFPSPQSPRSSPRPTVEFHYTEEAIENDHTLADNPKRRLSPGFIARRESESPSASSNKNKLHLMPANVTERDSNYVQTRNTLSHSDGNVTGAMLRRRRKDSTESECSEEPHNLNRNASLSSSQSPLQLQIAPLSCSNNGKPPDDEPRCVALSITAERLNIGGKEGNYPSRRRFSSETAGGIVCPSRSSTTPGAPILLIEQAVESATHTIVTDAIETLLRDESHSIETYLKHEGELSISSIPGVIPISKQLFAASAASTSKARVQSSCSSLQQVDEFDNANTSHKHRYSGAESTTFQQKIDRDCVDSRTRSAIVKISANTERKQSTNTEVTNTAGVDVYGNDRSDGEQRFRQPKVES